MSTWPGRADQIRCQSLDPVVQGHVVDSETALCEQLLEVTIGQSVSQIPPHGEEDHFRRESEPDER
jgi:hypothetical protein